MICTCPAQIEGGQVLLFYRYWGNTPKLPPQHADKTNDLDALAAFHRNLAIQLNLGGKFRFAKEGFNISLGGTLSSLEKYKASCRSHWSFAGLPLTATHSTFFNPTPGCACAFNNQPTTKITQEITPLGLTNYLPPTWSSITPLSPPAFHELCAKGEIPVLDVRNHYESRIGYFVTGEQQDVQAVRPAVRRFSQWPAYVARHVLNDEALAGGGPLATYCTGGIRCEKGARWMQAALAATNTTQEAPAKAPPPVYTLQGGILAYQAWIAQEIAAGRKRPHESFFKGKTYVFDRRGAVSTSTRTSSTNVNYEKINGHDEEEDEEEQDTEPPVSKCHNCNRPNDTLLECASPSCHLVLVVCRACEKLGVTCCEDCKGVECEKDKERGKTMEKATSKSKAHAKRRMCKCEKLRERELWGDGGARISPLVKYPGRIGVVA